VDLGASSGRVVLGWLEDDRVRLEEVHRFDTSPVRLPDGLYTDVLAIWNGIVEGLRLAGPRVAGIGVDSWAVDFGLLDGDGALVGNPRHYRDERNVGAAARAFARVSREEVYGITGIQFMPINTLDQLVAMEGSEALARASTLLLLPDLIAYWLCGEARAEVTNASTTQLWDARAGAWADGLIERLGIDGGLFAEPVEPGTVLGAVRAEVGLDGDIPVRVVGSHDTASAVAAVPATGDDFAYVSSGTWSLVGVELDEPVTTPEALAANVTNEAGLGGTVRALKNVMGLWLLQECRREWAGEGVELSAAAASRLAAEAPPGGPLIDPDALTVLPGGRIATPIQDACRETGQAVPESHAEIARTVLDSLACKTRVALNAVVSATKKDPAEIHIVGGGSQDATLCQLTADVLDRPVHAGPAEATALGNVLCQALGADRATIRATVRRSFPPTTYEPGPGKDAMQDAYARFDELFGDNPRGPASGDHSTTASPSVAASGTPSKEND
jgi:rhamnulokinase